MPIGYYCDGHGELSRYGGSGAVRGIRYLRSPAIRLNALPVWASSRWIDGNRQLGIRKAADQQRWVTGFGPEINMKLLWRCPDIVPPSVSSLVGRGRSGARASVLEKGETRGWPVTVQPEGAGNVSGAE